MVRKIGRSAGPPLRYSSMTAKANARLTQSWGGGVSLWLRLSSCKSFDASGINTTSILNPLIAYTGTNLETLATYPAGKARTIQLTLRGRPGKVETHDQAFVWRLRGKTPASLPQDTLTANQNNQLMIEGYQLMQGTQHILLAQNCISMRKPWVQKQAQPQTEATP